MNKLSTFTRSFLLLVALLFTSCAVDTPPSTSESTRPSSALEQNTYQWVNAYRDQKDRSPLARKSKLDRLAAEHATMLADGLSDYGHLKRSIYIKANRVLMSDVETLVYKNRTPETSEPAMAIIDYWKKRPIDNISLLRKWQHIGIGAAVDDSGQQCVIAIIGLPHPRGGGYLNNNYRPF